MRRKLAGLAAVIMGAAVTPGAFAADLPVKAPVYKAPPAAVFDWTGFYIGGYAGIAASRSRTLDPSGDRVGDGKIEHTGYGFTGGGTVGYNYQIDRRWVVGVEGDLGFFDTSRRLNDWDDDNLDFNAKTSWLGTLRGRVGWTDGPNLSYFTGGYAAVHLTDSNIDPTSGIAVSSSKTKSGYTFGSGVETMLGGGWTAKAESLYVNVGSGDVLNNTSNDFMLQTDKHRYYTQRFGINYLFGAKTGPLPQTNWSGFYAGVVGGGALASVRATGSTNGEIDDNGSGFSAGGQLGYNWMLGARAVVGVEGDISYLGISHRSDDFYNLFLPYTQLLDVKTSWIATARARLGYSTGPALLYVTGGAAWVKVKDSFTGPTAGALPLVTSSSSNTLSGWTAGGGIETTLWGNWSTKTEYLFVDVGRGDVLSGGTLLGNTPTSISADHRFHMFRSALVYRFGGGPAGGY